MKKHLLLLLCLIITFIYTLESRPQYSILQSYGIKCSGCHVNVQGGGVRNGGGWLARKDLSLIPTDAIGIDGFYSALDANSFLDDMISFGMDVRYQMATLRGVREFWFMQMSPYLVLNPIEWLQLEGFINAAYYIEKEKRYVGQQPYSFSLYLKPSEELPTLRVGYFQPAIGQKWDDHTMLIRNVPGAFGKRELIPSDYAEWGAQLDYENIPWLSLSAGAFTQDNMAALKVTNLKNESVSVVDSGSIGLALRGVVDLNGVVPSGLPMGLAGYAGGTYFFNDDYKISSVFFGAGKTDLFAVMGEFIYSEKADNLRKSYSFLAELTYQLVESFLPYIRAERSYSREATQPWPFYTTQWVFGVHINLLPYLDIFPEYRIYDREQAPGEFKSWAVQAHLFY